MKLIVFGPTGETGVQLVTQALEAGHEVTAFARQPEKMALKHSSLRVMQGDVLDITSVQAAIQGHDAVLCTLGTPAGNKEMLRANGTKNIILAMQNTSVRRLICQSGLGCGDSYQLLPWYYKYLIFPLILRHVYADHEIQERYIRESKLDWTIVRPAALTNGVSKGSYWHGFVVNKQSLKIKISRADVAGFMLKQLIDGSYMYRAPSLSY